MRFLRADNPTLRPLAAPTTAQGPALSLYAMREGAVLDRPRATRSATVAGTDDVMTVAGAVDKTLVLLGLLVASAAVTWRLGLSFPLLLMPLMIVGVVAGLVLAVMTGIKPDRSARFAPAYAVAEGLAIGGLSLQAEQELPGAVMIAAIATFATLGAMLLAYRSGLIRATRTFTRGVVTATGAIAMMYVISLVLTPLGIEVPFLHQSGPAGLLLSLGIIVVVALNLVLDFAFIEEAAARRAPRHLEWYGAFSLLVTLVWLYIEILMFILEHLPEGDD